MEQMICRSDLERLEHKIDELLAREPSCEILYSRSQLCKLCGIGLRKLKTLKARYKLPIGEVERKHGINPRFTANDIKAMQLWLKKNPV
jgi:hypothetical protein